MAALYPGLSSSVRAWVCEIDGVPEGIIGLALLGSASCLFSSFREPLRAHLRSLTILRLIKKAESAVRGSRVPVWAIADPDEPTAPGILKRLGFERFDNIDGDEIYVISGGGE